MRRRELLAGALAVGATAAIGTPAASAVPAGDPGETLERALFGLPAAEPWPLPRLTEALAAAREDFRAARYKTLGAALPGLLATAEATRDTATGTDREQAHGTAARAYVLAAELALKQHVDIAWVAADRALTAARASGAPVPIGEATRVLAITMRRAGRCQSAVGLLAREATSLDTGHVRAGAVRTALLLTAAYTAATAGERGTALDLLGEAEDAADRVPAAQTVGLYTVDASRAQVDVYRIGVHNALGTPDEAVPYAGRVDAGRLPTPERRARYWTDTARMWHALGDPTRTFGALRRVEQAAPQEVRRPALRALTADLLYGPARVPGLREFAVRTGAAA